MTPKRISNSSEHTEKKDENRATTDSPKGPGSAANRQRATTSEASPTPQEWLRSGLRKLYEDTVRDPLPESLTKLLDELDRKDRAKK